MRGSEVERKMGEGEFRNECVDTAQRENDKGRWGGRTREGAGYLPFGYFGNTDSRLWAASFKMETAVTRSGSGSTSQRL